MTGYATVSASWFDHVGGGFDDPPQGLSACSLSTRRGPVPVLFFRHAEANESVEFLGRLFRWRMFVLLILGWQSLGQCPDGAFEFGQVVVDGGLQDRVVSVEVTVSQVIAHARDLGPGDGGWKLSLSAGRAFTATDFQQSDPDGIEYQAVGQVALPEVGADGIDGGLNVGQSLPFPVGHSATRSCSARANGGLQVACRHQVDLGAEDGFQFSPDPSQPEQAHVRRQVHEQVHVTDRPVLTARQLPKTRRRVTSRAAAAATRSRRFRLTCRSTGSDSLLNSGG